MDVVSALAQWNRAIATLASATADIRAGRPIAAARLKAEQAIRDGTAGARIVGEATWFAPPPDTSKKWMDGLWAYQQELQRVGQITPTATPTPASSGDGLRIGNTIIPAATARNILLSIGVLVAVGLWLWSDRKRSNARREW